MNLSKAVWLLLLCGCANEYDARILSPSCILRPDIQYTFRSEGADPRVVLVGKADQYIPKCCSEYFEVCTGAVLKISCRDYVETWTVLDSVDGVLHLSIENKGPGVAEFHTLTAGALEVEDGGS